MLSVPPCQIGPAEAVGEVGVNALTVHSCGVKYSSVVSNLIHFGHMQLYLQLAFALLFVIFLPPS